MHKTVMSLFLAAALVAGTMDAQVTLRVPRISQGAKVSQIVGLSEIAITYHRPGVKGRVIWGNVVQYDTVWRAGANEPTLITFSDDATVNGEKLAAGTYRLLVLPHKEGDWSVIFNSDVKDWGTVYAPQYDVLKLQVHPETGPLEEWMQFSFTDLTPKSARVVLAWEKVRISFVVEFNTLAKVQASMGNWQLLNAAARFTLDNKVYPEAGMEWIERSIALDKNPRNLGTKAELLAAAGKFKEAVAAAEEAVTMAKAKDPKANTAGLEKMIADWKSKK